MLTQYRIRSVNTGLYISRGELIKPDLYDVTAKEVKESSCTWTTTGTVSDGFQSELYQNPDDKSDKIIFFGYSTDNTKIVNGKSVTSLSAGDINVFPPVLFQFIKIGTVLGTTVYKIQHGRYRIATSNDDKSIVYYTEKDPDAQFTSEERFYLLAL
ncbi:hypothetical protein NJB93_08810 [Brucella intermedia]|uniref:hypothetical protein n=1 Tax=Brucella intermedia TaxID=94625 RepID=UPI0013CEBDBB|nr:hypothetical protein [Brucella intermedia]MCO7726684.1 hypothetical protein [Brucella intermedia]